MAIHILQLLCPLRHCLTAVAWDDRTGNLADAEETLQDFTESLIDKYGEPRCSICASTRFHAEDGVTRFETMEEARPHLLAHEIAQKITASLMPRDRN